MTQTCMNKWGKGRRNDAEDSVHKMRILQPNTKVYTSVAESLNRTHATITSRLVVTYGTFVWSQVQRHVDHMRQLEN